MILQLISLLNLLLSNYHALSEILFIVRISISCHYVLCIYPILLRTTYISLLPFPVTFGIRLLSAHLLLAWRPIVLSTYLAREFSNDAMRFKARPDIINASYDR